MLEILTGKQVYQITKTSKESLAFDYEGGRVRLESSDKHHACDVLGCMEIPSVHEVYCSVHEKYISIVLTGTEGPTVITLVKGRGGPLDAFKEVKEEAPSYAGIKHYWESKRKQDKNLVMLTRKSASYAWREAWSDDHAWIHGHEYVVVSVPGN